MCRESLVLDLHTPALVFINWEGGVQDKRIPPKGGIVINGLTQRDAKENTAAIAHKKAAVRCSPDFSREVFKPRKNVTFSTA